VSKKFALFLSRYDVTISTVHYVKPRALLHVLSWRTEHSPQLAFKVTFLLSGRQARGGKRKTLLRGSYCGITVVELTAVFGKCDEVKIFGNENRSTL
jgi:hypothetical protein